MCTIFAVTGPIFALMGLGFCCVRLGLFQRADMSVLGRFVIHVALPALLVSTISQRAPAEIFRADYLLASAGGTLLAFLLVLGLALGPRRLGLQQSAIRAMGVSVSNKAFLGLPIVAQVVGGAAPVALALSLVAEDILVLPLALLLTDLGGRQRRGLWALLLDIGRSLAGNPVILAICIGLALSLLHVQAPDPLLRLLDMLGRVAAPTALFAIGGTLGGSLATLRACGSCGDIGLIAGVKLILHPFLVGLLALHLPLSPEMRAAAILYASMPMFSIYPLFGAKYGLEVFCSATVLLGTSASFITISTAIWCVQRFVLS